MFYKISLSLIQTCSIWNIFLLPSKNSSLTFCNISVINIYAFKCLVHYPVISNSKTIDVRFIPRGDPTRPRTHPDTPLLWIMQVSNNSLAGFHCFSLSRGWKIRTESWKREWPGCVVTFYDRQSATDPTEHNSSATDKNVVIRRAQTSPTIFWYTRQLSFLFVLCRIFP